MFKHRFIAVVHFQVTLITIQVTTDFSDGTTWQSTNFMPKDLINKFVRFAVLYPILQFRRCDHCGAHLPAPAISLPWRARDNRHVGELSPNSSSPPPRVRHANNKDASSLRPSCILKYLIPSMPIVVTLHIGSKNFGKIQNPGFSWTSIFAIFRRGWFTCTY